jgi:hypothetical protein
MLSGGDQVAGVGEAVRRWFGINDRGGVDVEISQVPGVQRLLDSNGP